MCFFFVLAAFAQWAWAVFQGENKTIHCRKVYIFPILEFSFETLLNKLKFEIREMQSGGKQEEN